MAEIPSLAMGFSNNLVTDWEEKQEVELLFSMQSQWLEWEAPGRVQKVFSTRVGNLEPVIDTSQMMLDCKKKDATKHWWGGGRRTPITCSILIFNNHTR